MKVGVAKETAPGERRVALVPEALGKLQAAGCEILVESGAGAGSAFLDAAYADAGATVLSTDALYQQADVILKVAKPSPAEVARLRQGQAVVGFLQPLIDPQLAKALADRGVTAISLDAIPRTLSRAQTMDALSSQANVGGYKAVLIAANAYPRYFPLLTTAAGTAKPANVLILGIGVAGLQAIGTAKRLGARVSANDVRAASADEVASMGGTFIHLDLDAAADAAGGYAKELGEDRAALQRRLLAPHIASADVLITTAAIPGRHGRRDEARVGRRRPRRRVGRQRRGRGRRRGCRGPDRRRAGHGHHRRHEGCRVDDAVRRLASLRQERRQPHRADDRSGRRDTRLRRRGRGGRVPHE